MAENTGKTIALIKALGGSGGGGGGGGAVDDVQINSTSILNGGVANIPIGGTSTLGVFKVNETYGTGVNNGGILTVKTATDAQIKSGSSSNNTRPVTPANQHKAIFFGLAKAAGDTTQSASSNEVGVYTETAQSKISDMLNAPVTVSGSTPSITGMAGVRYICGEVSAISITPPQSGCIDVVFESGSTPAVLTVPNTVKWMGGFDPTSLDADTTYEINILDGVYGVVGSWT